MIRHKHMAKRSRYDTEVHLAHNTGHEHSIHCWCEPFYYLRYVKLNGQLVTALIVEHEDEVEQQRGDVVQDRYEHPDWVTKLLEEIR